MYAKQLPPEQHAHDIFAHRPDHWQSDVNYVPITVGLWEGKVLKKSTFFAPSHVEADLPEALAKAEFSGPMLAPIGADPAVPGIIAAALTRNAARRAA